MRPIWQIIGAATLAAVLAGCTPPTGRSGGQEDAAVLAEPEAPAAVMESPLARTQVPAPCDEGDDGIGGTGCTPLQ